MAKPYYTLDKPVYDPDLDTWDDIRRNALEPLFDLERSTGVPVVSRYFIQEQKDKVGTSGWDQMREYALDSTDSVEIDNSRGKKPPAPMLDNMFYSTLSAIDKTAGVGSLTRYNERRRARAIANGEPDPYEVPGDDVGVSTLAEMHKGQWDPIPIEIIETSKLGNKDLDFIVQDLYHEQDLQKKFPNYDEFSGWGEGAIGVAGFILGGILLDTPLMAGAIVPLGTGVKSMAIANGALTAGDVARIDWEETGNVDYRHAMVWGAVGAALGGVAGHYMNKAQVASLANSSYNRQILNMAWTPEDLKRATNNNFLGKGPRPGGGGGVVGPQWMPEPPGGPGGPGGGGGGRSINQLTTTPSTPTSMGKRPPPAAGVDTSADVADSLNRQFGLGSFVESTVVKDMKVSLYKPVAKDNGIERAMMKMEWADDYYTATGKSLKEMADVALQQIRRGGVGKGDAGYIGQIWARRQKGLYDKYDTPQPVTQPWKEEVAPGVTRQAYNAIMDMPRKEIAKATFFRAALGIVENAIAKARERAMRRATKTERALIEGQKQATGEVLSPEELIDVKQLKRRHNAAVYKELMGDQQLTEIKNGIFRFNLDGVAVEVVDRSRALLKDLVPLTLAEVRAVNAARTRDAFNILVGNPAPKVSKLPGMKQRRKESSLWSKYTREHPAQRPEMFQYPEGSTGFVARIDGIDQQLLFDTPDEAMEWVMNAVERRNHSRESQWLTRQYQSKASPYTTPLIEEKSAWLMRNDMAVLQDSSTKSRVMVPGQTQRVNEPGDLTRPRGMTSPYKHTPPAETSINPAEVHAEIERRAGAPLRHPGQRKFGKQEGKLNEPMLALGLAGGVSGALIGYKLEGEEGAIYGALAGSITAGLGVPWIMSKLHPQVGSRPANNVYDVGRHMDNNFWMTGMDTMLDRLSDPIATQARKMLRDQKTEAALARGRMLHEWEKVLMDNGVEPDRIAKYMYNSGFLRPKIHMYDDLILGFMDRASRPELIRKYPHYANIYRKGDEIFVRIADQALESGVWTKEQYAKHMKDFREKGYWPRMWNDDYLSTVEGINEWNSVFMEKGMKMETAQRIVEGIANRKVWDALDGHWSQGADGLWRLDKEGARILREQRSQVRYMDQLKKRVTDRRSSHLEFERQLHVEDEKILEPFLHTDPIHVMGEYLNDSLTRIHGAKIWGPKDERFWKFHDHIYALNRDTGEAFFETYHAMQRSAKSKVVQQYRPPTNTLARVSKGIMRKIDHSMLLKMTYGVIVNLSQVPLNSALILSGMPTRKSSLHHFVKGWKDYMDSLKDIESVSQLHWMNKYNPRSFVKRSGAATDAMLMSTAGEGIQGGNKILPFATDRWGGPLYLADLFNNPSKFLHANAFLPQEYMNRSFAALIGRSYAEDLILSLRDIQRGRITDEKFIKRVHSALDELAIDPRLPAELIPEGKLEGAGLLFSQLVNHAPSPDTMPRILQSPDYKMFTRFKTFMYYQTKLQKNYMWKPALPFLTRLRDYGHVALDLKPLLAYLGVGTAYGMQLQDFRRWLNGDDRDFTLTEKWMDAISRIATLGFHYEAFMSLERGPHGPTSYLLGPSVDSATKFITDMYNVLDDNPYDGTADINMWKFVRALHRQTPPYPQKFNVHDRLGEKAGIGGRKKSKNIYELLTP